MSRKLFSFRWDIDHRACMTDGIPNIQAICREYDVRHTFFVNMGRSTNLREWLGKGFKGSRAKLAEMEAINLVKKIGWGRFAVETLLSRPVGRSFIPALCDLQADGHELGLHGGSDHVVWSRRFNELDDEVIEQDVANTLEEFVAAFGQPAGFTSPGFKSDNRIMRIVERLGFEYHGDAIGGQPAPSIVSGTEYDHWTVPVTICGPRTIPFFEWHSARGSSRQQALAAFEDSLDENSTAVLYGHPCHEGLDRQTLRKMFDAVLRAGFEFVTHAELVAHNKAAMAPGDLH
ncbi:MAG: hypothetical protein ACR2QR_00560 [Woeseiaceae bacterium]